MDEDYFNIYFAKIYDKAADQVTQKVGWQTTNRTKPLMINKLAEFIGEKWIGIKHKDPIKECLTYIIEDNGSTNAQEGCHDDLVMSLAICLMVYLEGKGENYVPYAEDKEKKTIKRPFDSPGSSDKDEDYDSENRVEVSL